MRSCSRCGRPVADEARFCAECGAPVSTLSQLPTEVATPSSPRSGSPIGRIDSNASGEFIPGQVIGGRYRVIGLLGRGGMGEVYRADDLKLESAVALKFLPRSLAARSDLMDRLLGEVRNARQVSHPNVCRVYDVGEIGGRPFLTMEYVDGEDLGTLLRRIGRLPRAKADQVGRQMCAGLAAAHDRGVIHRDLKPSNVMLDGEGRVRITDFGLAARSGESTPDEVSGTPAYMAPEQFDGQPGTVQSDLYSLGLILYELHTGRRALEGATWDQWRAQHQRATPSSPSAVEQDVDQAVSRAILRCLEKDPSRRPASALQLAAALPGGDPLAAALAAGETPSPQMVATAGGEGAIPLRRAGLLLGAVALLIAGLIAIGPRSTDLGLAPLTRSVPELDARAREINRQLGYGAGVRDRWFDVARDYERLKYIADHELSTRWRREFRTRGVPWLFRQRESPRLLLPAHQGPVVTPDNPPLDVTGMTSTSLDLEGRLRQFIAVPPQRDLTPVPTAPRSWADCFAAAGLDTAAFRRVVPEWIPSVAFDEHVEWRRAAPAGVFDSLVVTAAAWRGRPVYFMVRGPWSRALRDRNPPEALTQQVSQWVVGVMLSAVFLTSLWLARRHLRLGRGDARGARRFLFIILAVSLAHWLFSAHHVADAGAALRRFLHAVEEALLNSILLGAFYLAIEPFVRRYTPQHLIGWARLMEGRWRDPRVGRDVLIGLMLGLATSLMIHFSNALPSWLPVFHQTPVPSQPDLIAGAAPWLGRHFQFVRFGIDAGSGIFAAYFLLRMLLRRSNWAAVVLVGLATVLSVGSENPLIEVPFSLVIGSTLALAIVRFGLLATYVTLIAFFTAGGEPWGVPPGSPAFPPFLVSLAAIAALAFWAFRTSIGSRPLFQLPADDPGAA